MLWSPIVRRGLLTEIEDKLTVELFINGSYSAAINELRNAARLSTADINNPAFRVLQILEHLR